MTDRRAVQVVPASPYVARPVEPFRWVEATPRARHAVPAELELVAGAEVTTLCGEHAELVHPSPRLAWPECRACERVWRQVLGIPAHPWDGSR